MKEFLNVMMKDYKDENFTRNELLIFGIVVPVVFTVVVCFASWLDSVCK